MQLTFWQKTRYGVLLLLLFLITLSSHPTIVAMSRAAGMESGTILSRYIILVFAGLFVMCLNVRSMLKPKMIRGCWLIMLLIVLYYMITFALFGRRIMLNDVRSILICLVAIMIGWQMNLDKKRFHLALLIFALLTLFVGLMQVLTNVGGFVILDQYHADNKNSLGVMLATSVIVLLFMALNNRSTRFFQIVLFALAVFTLVILLTIRARAATLTSGIMLLYIFYERYKGKNFVIYLTLGIFVLVMTFIFMPNSIKQFVYDSFFQNYEGGDITAGRASRNRAALDYLSQNIWLGNIRREIDIPQIHNYPLNRTFEFGLVFAFPILLMYLFILVNTIVKTIKSDNHNNYNIGYYLLLIPFIISMAEPTFPFGPGTATVFNFLMFGVALRNTYCEKLGDNFRVETPQLFSD